MPSASPFQALLCIAISLTTAAEEEGHAEQNVAYAEDDEENDAKLFADIIQSVRQWQKGKERKEDAKKRG